MRKPLLFLSLAGTALGLVIWNRTTRNPVSAPQDDQAAATAQTSDAANSQLNSNAQPSRSSITSGAGTLPGQPPASSTSPAAQSSFDAYAHFQMGNYEGAVSQLRAALKSEPGNELVRRNLSTALLALGFFKLQKKEVADAEAAFEDSAKFGNEDARKALAGLKLRQGQIESAREILEELSSRGSDLDSMRVLIDLALSQDELERADDLLNRLNEKLQKPELAQTPAAADLLTFIEARKKRLEQKRNFLKIQDVVTRQGIEVSYSTAELRPMADAVARAIETVQNRLSQMLGPLPAHARLRAWLVPTNDFNRITGAPPWAAAVFDGYIRIPVGRTVNGRPVSVESIEALARHETTHAYMYAFCGDLLPSWMGEGLAQVYEGRNANQSQSDLLRTLGRKALQSIEPEIERPFTEAPANLVGRLYARSHLLVQAMSREGGGVNTTWQRVLSAVCVQRRPLPEVLQEQFAVSNVNELWARYHSTSEP
ncbi:MAG: tetratricopeptide repeat protein [Betaproteobacteria bacterium]|nr:tetratricopeptide repeat protein [Betaproteobacteria bacterium]